MNRSPTLAVRRCNEYAFCVSLDHCHKTESESLLLLKGSKFLQSLETLTCSVPSFLQTRRGLFFSLSTSSNAAFAGKQLFQLLGILLASF